MATDPVCGMAVEREKAVEFECEGKYFTSCAVAGNLPAIDNLTIQPRYNYMLFCF
jgi:hypothetical protein